MHSSGPYQQFGQHQYQNHPHRGQPYQDPQYSDYRSQNYPRESYTYPSGYTPAQQQAPLAASPPRRRRRGGLYVVLGVLLAVVAGAAVVVGTGTPERYPAPADQPAVTEAGAQVGFREEGTVSAWDLQPGDCYNTGLLPPAPGETQPVSTVEAVPCASPHTEQVVTTISYGPSDFADVSAGRAESDCMEQLISMVAPRILADGTYRAGLLMPSDELSWNSSPAVACIVTTEQPTTGSALKS